MAPKQRFTFWQTLPGWLAYHRALNETKTAASKKKKKKEEKRPEVPKRKYANQVPLTSGCFQNEKKRRKKEEANKCKIKGE